MRNECLTTPSLCSWQDFVRECFCFVSDHEAMNAGDKAVRGYFWKFLYYELLANLMFEIRHRNASGNIQDLFQD